MNAIIALVLASSILIVVPGPNVALIVANSLRYGLRTGIHTVLGTTCGVGLQLFIVTLGLVAVVEVAAEALFWIRWLGVAYLVGLGVRTWRRAATDLDEIGAVPPVFQHGLLLAAINPKTLLFNAAFIPQFAGSGSLFEFVTVSAVFLSVVFIGDLAWAIFANGAHGLLSRYTQWRNRVTGGVLIAAGVGLALSRR